MVETGLWYTNVETEKRPKNKGNTLTEDYD